jgi:hypothetical protein
LDHVSPGRLRQKNCNALFVTEERFHFRTQFNITGTSCVQKRYPCGWIKIKRLID